MTNRPKPFVGQKLFYVNVGNNAIRHEQKIKKCKVTKVGRKYFTTDTPYQNNEWYISNWGMKTNYCAGYKLYESSQEWEDEIERKRLASNISDTLRYSSDVQKLPIEKLRAINEILEERKND